MIRQAGLRIVTNLLSWPQRHRLLHDYKTSVVHTYDRSFLKLGWNGFWWSEALWTHCPFYHETPVRLLLLWDTPCAFRILSHLLFILCSPMRFSRGFIYKCLLADQTSPRSYGGAKLMLGACGQKERKREAIILPIHRCFLLLFHPLEAQEVHPQTIWYLEICCESWGNARAQQYPRGPRGALRLTPSPRLSVAQFPSRVSLSHFCQCVSFLACNTCAALQCRKQYPHWDRQTVFHLSASLNSRKATGINPLCSLW